MWRSIISVFHAAKVRATSACSLLGPMRPQAMRASTTRPAGIKGEEPMHAVGGAGGASLKRIAHDVNLVARIDGRIGTRILDRLDAIDVELVLAAQDADLAAIGELSVKPPQA